MSHPDEEAALEHVVHALAARFPSVGIDAVRSVVAEVYQTFDGPVREYVPLLVERVSRDRLREVVDGDGSPTTTAFPRSTSAEQGPAAPVTRGGLAVPA